MTNQAIAEQLRAYAAELSRRRDNLYRIRAFRQAAFAVSGLPVPLDELIHNQPPAKKLRLPGIGDSICDSLVNYIRTGHWPRT